MDERRESILNEESEVERKSNIGRKLNEKVSEMRQPNQLDYKIYSMSKKGKIIFFVVSVVTIISAAVAGIMFFK